MNTQYCLIGPIASHICKRESIWTWTRDLLISNQMLYLWAIPPHQGYVLTVNVTQALPNALHSITAPRYWWLPTDPGSYISHNCTMIASLKPFFLRESYYAFTYFLFTKGPNNEAHREYIPWPHYLEVWLSLIWASNTGTVYIWQKTLKA